MIKRIATFLAFICLFVIVGAVCLRFRDDASKPVQQQQCTAIVVVHFGTTFDDTRHKTLDAITRAVANSFPDNPVHEAYSSPTVVKKLKERGIDKCSPREMLDSLIRQGYRRIVVQPSFMLDGIEMSRLTADVNALSANGVEIVLGRPLLYTADDCRALVHALADSVPRDETLVLVGHGTETPATAIYPMIEHIAHGEGLPNVIVGTIEGYPTLDDLVASLKTQTPNPRQILLQPFMLVAGDHANNDIAVDWHERLTSEGYDVQVRKTGIGELPIVHQLIINRIRSMM